MNLLHFCIASLCMYAHHVEGLSTFHMNCTLPDRRYDYVQGPNTRGTLQIVWSCLATLILCTYTVLHLNIPEQRDGRDGAVANCLKMTERTRCSWLQQLANDAYWCIRGAKPSFKWMLITLTMPEYYTMRALEGRNSATHFKEQFEKLERECRPTYGWTLTHMFFANMGGFAVRMKTTRRDEDIVHLTAASLVQIMDQNHQFLMSESLPNKEEIQGRSKSDHFAKSLIVIQVVWFILNCITRLARRLPTTQLEMSVLATAACSLITYAILFQKPQSVKSPIIVRTYCGDETVPPGVREIIEKESTARSAKGTIINHDDSHLDPTKPLSDWMWMTVFPILAAVVGAPHVAAWNFAFPSEADKWIWRSASLALCAFFPAWTAFDLVLWYLKKRPRCQRYIEASKMALYVSLRFILMVQMIRFLFYIPPRGFMTTWADNVPHI